MQAEFNPTNPNHNNNKFNYCNIINNYYNYCHLINITDLIKWLLMTTSTSVHWNVKNNLIRKRTNMAGVNYLSLSYQNF